MKAFEEMLTAIVLKFPRSTFFDEGGDGFESFGVTDEEQPHLIGNELDDNEGTERPEPADDEEQCLQINNETNDDQFRTVENGRFGDEGRDNVPHDRFNVVLERRFERVVITLQTVREGITLFKNQVRRYVYLQNAFPNPEEVYYTALCIAKSINGIHDDDPRDIRVSGPLIAVCRDEMSTARTSAHSAVKDFLLTYTFARQDLSPHLESRSLQEYWHFLNQSRYVPEYFS
ncbi:hypothetical protein BJV82DRAFT_669282 [Fennellomyces sp. T-0311]|nr:hypothetical protein BJV82DRAFT_669282 [Fennellomyces sp. T-0311]